MHDKISTSLSQTPQQVRGLLTGYGEGGFKINGEFFAGSVSIYGSQVMKWDVNVTTAITPASLEPILFQQGIELLLVGTGVNITAIDPSIRSFLKSKNIALDVMDTGAACRTFNVLVGEERRAGLAAIAI